MSLLRKSCRTTERVSMKKMHAQGITVSTISKKLRVHPDIIQAVIDGKWDQKERAATLASMKANEEKMLGKRDEEANRIAQIAAAAAAAITGQNKGTDKASLRAEIEAQVRAEMAAEKEEMSPQQRGALTRKKNAEAAGEQEKAQGEETQSAA